MIRRPAGYGTRCRREPSLGQSCARIARELVVNHRASEHRRGHAYGGSNRREVIVICREPSGRNRVREMTRAARVSRSSESRRDVGAFSASLAATCTRPGRWLLRRAVMIERIGRDPSEALHDRDDRPHEKPWRDK